MSFLKRFRNKPETVPPPLPEAPPPVPSKAKGFVPPPPRPVTPISTDPKMASLQRRRERLEQAIEQVEESASPNSSFQQQVAVLNDTLATVEDEIRAVIPLPSYSRPRLPVTPIEHIVVTLDPVPAVRFTIGPAHFAYAEEIDWAERGTTIVKGDLRPEIVEIDPLLPDSISGQMRNELAMHLDRSVFAFATDMRDRTVEGRALPTNPTLTDLALPCPKCGDWQLWGGLCVNCLQHETRLRDLNLERANLLDERAAVLEERQRQVEELPIQRKRLAQTIAEMQTLQS